MSDTPSFKIAQAVGILGSAFASGGILSISCLTVPALALPARSSHIKTPATGDIPASPISHITHQWLYAYDKGKVIFPSLAATSALAYTYVACTLRHTTGGYASSGTGKLSRLYLIAAATTMTIVPYTLVVMLPVNRQLAARARRDDASEREGKEGMAMGAEEEARRAREDREAPGLLQKWSCLNVVRALFPLAGASVGIAAILCS